MKQSKKTIFMGLFKAFIFALICVVIYLGLSFVFIPRGHMADDGTATQISNAYRGEDANSVDVMLVGNSDMYRGFSPADMYENTGITSCVAGKPSLTIHDAKNYVADIYKYQTPKVLVLEVDCIFDSMNPDFMNDNQKSKYEAQKKNDIFSKSRVAVINTKSFITKFDSAITSKINFAFPLFKYHNNWKKMNINYFQQKSNAYKFVNKGMVLNVKADPYTNGFNYMGSKDAPAQVMAKKDRDSIDYIYKYATQKGSQVVFLAIPSANSWNFSKNKAIQKVADEYGIKFYDYNVNQLNNFDWMTDTKDGGNHLNYSGCKKITSDLQTKLMVDYGLKKSDLTQIQQKQWDNDCKSFQKKVESQEKKDKKSKIKKDKTQEISTQKIKLF